MTSGNYSVMRGLWGASKCESQDDIPGGLSGITFKEENIVSYNDKEGQEVMATTMKGAAKASIPDESVFEEFFTEVMSSEEKVFGWAGRGPRIFNTIQGLNGDIVGLQEYDCHNSTADYRGEGEETFADAMTAAGYHGAFYKDPLLDRFPPAGIATFWKSFASLCHLEF